MARRDYYDWRGIAMLTQQMGQLFEPSKARLMSQQQEHEMNMLMAKKAWDTQSHQLDLLKAEHGGLLTKISTAEEKLMSRDLPELIKASKEDGANASQSATVLQNTSGKTLGDLNAMARKYEDMILTQESTLSNMKRYNAEALIGENWTNSLTARPTEKREDIKGRNYKARHDADKSGTLSWEEQNSALREYMKDYYQPAKGEEGIKLMVGNEEVVTTPEAQAFLAGFRHVRGRRKVDATEKTVSNIKSTDDLLNVMHQSRKTLDDYHQRGLDVYEYSEYKKEGYLKGNLVPGDYDMYGAAGDVFKTAYKSFVGLGGVVPDDLKGNIPVNEGMFYEGGEKAGFWGTDNAKQFTEEGLDIDKYLEIQNSDNKTYKEMAFKIVYNWDDIMKTGSDTEKANMLKSFEILKNQFKF